MLQDFTQDTKLIRATSDLGAGVLLPTSVRTEEGLSTPFRIIVEAVSARDDITPAELIGSPVGLEVHVSDERSRQLHGRVARLEAGRVVGHGFRQYALELVPWTWFLDRRVRCRIFQEKSIPQILEQVLADHPFADFSLDGVGGEHSPLEYCVQYRESDFRFAQRLMERAGIFYRFDHTASTHKLVLADSKAVYTPAEPSSIDLVEGTRPDDHLWTWRRTAEFIPGATAHEDYEFKTPSLDLEVGTSTVLDLPHAVDHEVYEYPGGFLDRSEGERIGALRMEELEARHERVVAEGAVPLVGAGQTFTVGQHDVASEEGREWLIVAVRQTASDETHQPGGTPRRFATVLEAIPAERTFRPERRTPIPEIRGPQTAVVTGPSGEEIYTDEYGRIKVHFHWDREGTADEASSCFLRIAQSAAGSGWGAVYTPRIGEEVVVGFIDADPDRPFVMGAVYNAERLPPFGDSSSNRNYGFKSLSTGGDASKFSELRFDDTGGSELLYMKAEKDMHQQVLNDQTIEVLNNRTEAVSVDEVVTVGGTRTHTITGDDTVTDEANRVVAVIADETRTVDANRSSTIGGNDTLSVKGDRSGTVKGADDLSVTGDRSISVTGNLAETVKGDLTESVTGKINVKGDQIVLAVGGTTITIKKDSITLKSGSSTVKLDSGGVTIKGSKVKVN